MGVIKGTKANLDFGTVKLRLEWLKATTHCNISQDELFQLVVKNFVEQWLRGQINEERIEEWKEQYKQYMT